MALPLHKSPDMSVKSNYTVAGAIVLGALTLTTYSHSQTPAPKAAPMVKIAIIAMRDAMLATKEGQKAGKEMQAKFEPRRAAVEKLARELQAGDEQLRKGAATMSPDARQKLADEMASKKKRYDRQ